MSLTKRSLPEDVDVTDERDTGFYGEPEYTPTATDWAMWELQRASNDLITNASELTVGDIQDLTQVMARLSGLIDHIRKPF